MGKETKDIKDTKKTVVKNIKKVATTKFNGIEGKFLLVRVGTNDRPADSKQIEEIESKLVSFFEKNNVNCLAFVTHHAVTIDMYGE